MNLIVAEARTVYDSPRVVPLTKSTVAEYYPRFSECIDWDRLTFEVPVETAAPRRLRAQGDVDEMAIYLGKALLAAGFSGNALFVDRALPGESPRERFTWTASVADACELAERITRAYELVAAGQAAWDAIPERDIGTAAAVAAWLALDEAKAAFFATTGW